VLELDACDIADKGAISLAHMLIKNRSLSSLSLRKNKIHDYSAKWLIKSLSVNKKLTRLKLTKNPVSIRLLTGLDEALKANMQVIQSQLLPSMIKRMLFLQPGFQKKDLIAEKLVQSSK